MELTISLVLLILGVTARCESFDYVIAGAGTCGLLLANRLSEDPNVRVAVIEPGGDVRNNPNVTDVTAFTRALGTEIDWQYTTTPQSKAGGREITFHAGKAIGGTSTINGMTYIRGDKPEFDAWESLGNDGWNWDSLYPYFKKVERFSVPTTAQEAAGASYDLDFHGERGLLKTGFPFELANGSLHTVVRESWEYLVYPLNPDVNSGVTRGFDIWPQTLDRDADVREDAARAYYYPVEGRDNLKIIKGTATKLAWDNSSTSSALLSASGIEYLDAEGQTATLTAAKEVILSAGAVRSPLILERSGVGNHLTLDKYGIETKISLPGVGENLQEQPNVILEYTSTNDSTGTTPYATFATAYDLFGNKTASVAAAADLRLPEWAQKVADASKGAVNATQLLTILRVQHDLMFNKNVTIAEIITAASGNILISAFWPTLPFSRGSVHIQSAEEDNNPAIDPRYFLINFDMSLQTTIGRLAQELWHTSPISELVVDNVVPGGTDLPRDATNSQWAAFIKSTMTPNHHPVGSAAMMSRDLGGVVDPELKVYGTLNVRVVDASVLPTQISGHLTATLYAVAERAAGIIKNT
ncbi:putative GMC oxidoreductase [Hypoxylon sp. CI-4A]|nr:putative GMC oxidoreductase [Hypoxylon sp. CI-4A]